MHFAWSIWPLTWSQDGHRWDIWHRSSALLDTPDIVFLHGQTVKKHVADFRNMHNKQTSPTSVVYWQSISGIIELDDGKIYRKPLYLMVKTMVSCRFSLKPIHWWFQTFTDPSSLKPSGQAHRWLWRPRGDAFSAWPAVTRGRLITSWQRLVGVPNYFYSKRGMVKLSPD